MGEDIVCGCCFDHQVVTQSILALCFGLYPSSCEVILVLVCDWEFVVLVWRLPQGGGCDCRSLPQGGACVCWLGVVPPGGGCACKERSWVLLVRVLCGLS